MRLAHLADVHLGFRQYERLSAAGANLREQDVAQAFARAIDGVIAARVDLVLIAGDFFHAVRPTNGAILAAFRELSRLRQALPAAPVIVISGDHDTPRAATTTPILPLYAALGVDVVQTGVVRLERAGAVVTCVPQGALAGLADVAPVPGRLNILLAHGEARDLPYQARTIPDTALTAAWDYIALGHYHVHQQVAPRAWYAGSLDYVSTDPWKDLREQARAGLAGKGWLRCDLPGGAPALQVVPPARPFLDLPRVDATQLGPQDLTRVLLERLASVPDGAVCRVIVDDVPRAVSRDLAWDQIREAKSRLTMLQLDLRRPEVEAGVQRRAQLFRNLDQEVEAWLTERGTELHATTFPELDVADFVERGMTYVHNAGRKPADPADPLSAALVEAAVSAA